MSNLLSNSRDIRLEKKRNISLEARLDNLHTIRDFIEQSGEEFGVVSDALGELKLAVDEAVTNIILHSDGGKGNTLEVAMAPLKDTNAVEITIKDKAARFDSNKAVEPLLNTPLEDRPYGGMGLYLIRKLTDEAEFSYVPEQGNQLRLLKLGALA